MLEEYKSYKRFIIELLSLINRFCFCCDFRIACNRINNWIKKVLHVKNWVDKYVWHYQVHPAHCPADELIELHVSSIIFLSRLMAMLMWWSIWPTIQCGFKIHAQHTYRSIDSECMLRLSRCLNYLFVFIMGHSKYKPIIVS